MPGNALTETTPMQCPHGGVVRFTSANKKVVTAGVSILLASDIGTITGCAFTLPGPKPSPCVVARWIAASAEQKTRTAGGATLSVNAKGLCYSAEQAVQGPIIIIPLPSVLLTM
jgi:hypothetical protein